MEVPPPKPCGRDQPERVVDVTAGGDDSVDDDCNATAWTAFMFSWTRVVQAIYFLEIASQS